MKSITKAIEYINSEINNLETLKVSSNSYFDFQKSCEELCIDRIISLRKDMNEYDIKIENLAYILSITQSQFVQNNKLILIKELKNEKTKIEKRLSSYIKELEINSSIDFVFEIKYMDLKIEQFNNVLWLLQD